MFPGRPHPGYVRKTGGERERKVRFALSPQATLSLSLHFLKLSSWPAVCSWSSLNPQDYRDHLQSHLSKDTAGGDSETGCQTLSDFESALLACVAVSWRGTVAWGMCFLCPLHCSRALGLVCAIERISAVWRWSRDWPRTDAAFYTARSKLPKGLLRWDAKLTFMYRQSNIIVSFSLTLCYFENFSNRASILNTN